MSNTPYLADPDRYASMQYRRCGRSGLLLPAICFGMWQHFSHSDDYSKCRAIILRAFDRGVTHFDAANNYGGGDAEEILGRILREDLARYRDEILVSTKAGYTMWPGPYGDWGSRKYLLASLDQSLKRLGLDYVDIFYSHRPDPGTPLEETMGALASAVQSGKALYAGISNYPPDQTEHAAGILRAMGVPCLVNQSRYSMFHRIPEEGLIAKLDELGIGFVAFQPLAQGLLTNRYLDGIPTESRVATGKGSLKREQLNDATLTRLKALNEIAKDRGQSLAQLALAWALRDERVTSVLIGASSVAQLENSLDTLAAGPLSDGEIDRIEQVLSCQYH